MSNYTRAWWRPKAIAIFCLLALGMIPLLPGVKKFGKNSADVSESRACCGSDNGTLREGQGPFQAVKVIERARAGCDRCSRGNAAMTPLAGQRNKREAARKHESSRCSASSASDAGGGGFKRARVEAASGKQDPLSALGYWDRQQSSRRSQH